jgi:hypothetical protein
MRGFVVVAATVSLESEEVAGAAQVKLRFRVAKLKLCAATAFPS